MMTQVTPLPRGSGPLHGGTTRSDLDLGDALVIVHPLLAPALERNIAEVMAPAIWRAITSSSHWTLSKPRLCDLSDADWRQLLHETERGDLPLHQLFSTSSGPAIYFGMAPMPVALELGRRLGPTHRVLAYYEGPNVSGPRPELPRR
jgi:hypothetical protein